MRRLQILVSSHELSPYQGSECAVGWNLVSRLGKYHNITVLYASTNHFRTSNYSEDIKKFIEANGKVTGVNFISIPQPKITRITSFLNSLFTFKESGIGFPPFFFWGYKHWQKAANREAKKILINNRFDLIHLLTAVSYREPGYLWKLDLPFVWGPTSGTFNTPRPFVKHEGVRSQVIDLFRRGSNFLIKNLGNRIPNVARKSSLIYAVSHEDEAFFKKYNRHNLRIMQDTGTFEINNAVLPDSQKDKVKLIWCGRIEASKGLDLFIRALAKCQLDESRISIKIIGDGSQRIANEKLANELKINNIDWLGQVGREAVLDNMSKADILVHTSYKEATSAVITEALSHGLAIICHDAYGMAVAVDDASGIKVPTISPKESINGFSKAIKTLVENQDLLLEMRKSALKRSKELSWDSMAEQIAKDYSEIVEAE